MYIVKATNNQVQTRRQKRQEKAGAALLLVCLENFRYSDASTNHRFA